MNTTRSRDHGKRGDHFTQQYGLHGVAFTGKGGAEFHAPAHLAPEKQGQAANNRTGKLRQYVCNGKASLNLAKQPEYHRNGRVDMRPAYFSDGG